MSRRRDREKREKRLMVDDPSGDLIGLARTRPGSMHSCHHTAEEYIANGYRCPETDSQGVCMAEIPF